VRSLAQLWSKTFGHGVHPDELKRATSGLAIERMPFVNEYVLPLAQHTGAPSKPLVLPGDRVTRGQMIAAPDGFVSTALHAPVTGEVESIELRPHPNGHKSPAIVIRTDPFSSQRVAGEPADGAALSAGEFEERVQGGGIVGLGGAAFPSHVKLRVPDGKRVHFVILNGCECEPYLTCDHRVMVERPREVVRGLRLIMNRVGAERGYIGIEENKPDAIELLRSAAEDDETIAVVPLAVKYPQGAEKMLIDAIFHREVPSGKLPLDLEIVVQNVGTAAALVDLLESGKPLIERVVTVVGTGVKRPANMLVPLGTPIQAVLDHCGGLSDDTKQVILGGPMMGLAQKRLDVPVMKGTSGILAFTKSVQMVEEDPCIRCGRCLEACPIFLNPSRLSLLARREHVDDLEAHNVLDCCECASCSFVCPSNIPLVQLMRVGKAMVRQQKDRR